MSGVVLLAVVAAVAMAANWIAKVTARQRLEWVSKPVATGALVAIAALAPGAAPHARGWWVAALVACLAGDVLLMLPHEQFVPGLVAFLAGHVLFIVGLLQLHGRGRTATAWVSVVVVAVGVAVVARPVLRGVRGSSPELVVPVVAYIAVISAMVLAAGHYGGWWATGGAVAFYKSDSLLAWDRFVRPSRAVQVLVMVTYHAALAGLVVALFR